MTLKFTCAVALNAAFGAPVPTRDSGIAVDGSSNAAVTLPPTSRRRAAWNIWFCEYLFKPEIAASKRVTLMNISGTAADRGGIIAPVVRRRGYSIMFGRVAVSLTGVWSALCLCASAWGDSGAELSPIVVTATRVAESSQDLPVSIDLVNKDAIHRGQPQVNLSESLITVPGVSIQSRQNYAQDLQLSLRGFGARSSFGVRGLRLYSDGIPGTMPDGQGQFSQFDLGSADHIEVLRGPFSALYGNSSGGVIAIFTQEGKPVFEADGTAEYGTFNTQRYALKGSGDAGAVNYVVDAAHFQTDGYRDHSDAERNNFNSKVRFNLDAVSKLTVVVNAIETPFVQDPLGLTRAQFAADPRQAGTNAIA